jgi:hypothetical protein
MTGSLTSACHPASLSEPGDNDLSNPTDHKHLRRYQCDGRPLPPAHGSITTCAEPGRSSQTPDLTGPAPAWMTSSVADLVARYAMRWAIEVTFFDCRQTLGVGQARNRVPLAVQRTWTFGMYVYSLVVVWYAISGHKPTIVTQRRLSAPWYLSKTDPSFADMLTTLRHTIIAAQFMGSRPAQPTNAEIRQVQHAWALAAA